jgi:hypothetical protein
MKNLTGRSLLNLLIEHEELDWQEFRLKSHSHTDSSSPGQKFPTFYEIWSFITGSIRIHSHIIYLLSFKYWPYIHGYAKSPTCFFYSGFVTKCCTCLLSRQCVIWPAYLCHTFIFISYNRKMLLTTIKCTKSCSCVDFKLINQSVAHRHFRNTKKWKSHDAIQYSDSLNLNHWLQICSHKVPETLRVMWISDVMRGEA